MNHETTQARSARPMKTNQGIAHHKHAAVERWLRREREKSDDSTFRWFG